jgi:hypothetical protein
LGDRRLDLRLDARVLSGQLLASALRQAHLPELGVQPVLALLPGCGQFVLPDVGILHRAPDWSSFRGVGQPALQRRSAGSAPNFDTSLNFFSLI